MPTISTSHWAAAAPASPPRDAIVRAALLGARDLLQAALDGAATGPVPLAPERPAGVAQGAAEVALAAVDAALALVPPPAHLAEHPPAAVAPAVARHLDSLDRPLLDRPIELPVDLRANIHLV